MRSTLGMKESTLESPRVDYDFTEVDSEVTELSFCVCFIVLIVLEYGVMFLLTP